jgi:hypothetical protein
MLFTSTMPTHAEKKRERRVLFPLKRANISPFGLYDRAAGRTNKQLHQLTNKQKPPCVLCV